MAPSCSSSSAPCLQKPEKLETETPKHGPKHLSRVASEMFLSKKPGWCFFLQVGVKWMFPKIGVPQNGWFIMENPIKIPPNLSNKGFAFLLCFEILRWNLQNLLTMETTLFVSAKNPRLITNSMRKVQKLNVIGKQSNRPFDTVVCNVPIYRYPSWRFQPIWKVLVTFVKMGIFPN